MKQHNTFISVCIGIITTVFGVYVLSVGSTLLIPFILAILLSFIIISVAGFFRKKHVPKAFSFLLALFLIAVVLYTIGKIVNTNIEGIIATAPMYQEKLILIFNTYMQKYEIDASLIETQILEKIDLTSLISNAASAVTGLVKNAGLIFFFTIFILLESTAFKTKLSLITGGEKSTFFTVFGQIRDDMKAYFMIKTITSLSVAFLSAIIMFFFGLDFFIFWAFIIFLLNYIPNVGSIIAVFFPVLFSLVQFESVYITTVFLFLMVAAQVFIGNFIEPRIMGNKLNLSPLVILMGLIFWGTLWGPIGMLLSVPIMVMINITLAHIETTRPIAILLSEKGVVKFTPPKITKKKKISIKGMKNLLKK